MDTAQRNLDLTEGVIWKKLLLFLLPIAAGTLFQQFYSTVDAVIVGQFVGSDALAAVGGSAAVIVQLVVGIFTGLSSGATVVISHGYGAGDKEKLHHAVHSAIAFSLLAGAAITVVGILLTPDALRWTKNPEEIMGDATLYLRLYFLGTIPTLLFNMGSGILRAVGDARRPLYYLIVCCLLNVVLDLLFVAGFHLGVAGAAIATTIANLTSALLILRQLARAQGTIASTPGRSGSTGPPWPTSWASASPPPSRAPCTPCPTSSSRSPSTPWGPTPWPPGRPPARWTGSTGP